jgi:hypothetical protein
MRGRTRPRWLNLARRIGRRIVDQFADPRSGALYLTPREHEPLLTRPLAHADDATPSGAGQAALALARLGHLVGDGEAIEAARRAVAAAGGDLERAALPHATLVRAALELQAPPTQVLLGGPESVVDDWYRRLAGRDELRVYRVCDELPDDGGPEMLRPLAAAQEATAVVCRGTHCLDPAHDFDALEARLSEAAD